MATSFKDREMLIGLSKKLIKDLTTEIADESKKVQQALGQKEIDEIFNKIDEAMGALPGRIKQLRDVATGAN